jgi:hypothetical protein
MAEPAYRVFLSHSSKDKDFVRELYRRLARDGVSCFFDIESIGWGRNSVRALERALDEFWKDISPFVPLCQRMVKRAGPHASFPTVQRTTHW